MRQNLDINVKETVSAMIYGRQQKGDRNKESNRQCQLSSSCTSGLIDPTYNVADNFVCDLTVDQCKEACIGSNGQHGNKDRRGNIPTPSETNKANLAEM